MDISSVTVEQYQDAETLLTRMLAEKYPNYSLSAAGVLNKMLVRPAAILYAAANSDVEDLRGGFFIGDILESISNGDPVDSAIVDKWLNNYGVSRRAGTPAEGTVVIVISRFVSTMVSADTTFTSASGAVFKPVEACIAVTDATLKTSSQQRVITASPNGTFAFTVRVAAVDAGSNGMVAAGTSFAVSPAILYGVTDSAYAYAESDFSGGSDAETDAEALSRLEAGIMPAAPSNRLAYGNFIREEFPGIIDLSIMGAGDGEMRRDRHNLFGAGGGGKVDVYARSALYPATVMLPADTGRAGKLASRVAGSDTRLVVSLAASVTDMAGFYRVYSILPAGSAPGAGSSLTIVSETRGVNAGAIQGTVPFFGDAIDAVFSPYQTCSVVFEDPSAAFKNDDDLEYDVCVQGMPQLTEMQEYVGGENLMPPATDTLVRAPIPCFVYVTAKVAYRYGYFDLTDDNKAKVRSAVSAAINMVPFTMPRLSSSVIVGAISSVMSGSAITVGITHIKGNILLASGGAVNIRGSDSLIVPSDTEAGLSRRVVAFFSSPDNVDVTYEAVS